MKVFTCGYYGRKLEDFKATVKQLNAVVIDIRLVPQSRFFPDWRKGNLEKVFGDAYLHVRDLGNKGFKEKRIEIADLERGTAIVRAIDRNVILLCACKNFQTCHRKPVAEELQRQGCEVEELQ